MLRVAGFRDFGASGCGFRTEGFKAEDSFHNLVPGVKGLRVRIEGLGFSV